MRAQIYYYTHKQYNYISSQYYPYNRDLKGSFSEEKVAKGHREHLNQK